MPTNGDNAKKQDSKFTTEQKMKAELINDYISNPWMRSFDLITHIPKSFRIAVVSLFYFMLVLEAYMVVDMWVAGGHQWNVYGGASYNLYLNNAFLAIMIEAVVSMMLVIFTVVGTLRFYVDSVKRG